MSVIKCCKDCPDRHECCWSDCERYLKEKSEHDKDVQRGREYLDKFDRTYSHRKWVMDKKMRKLGR